MNKKVEKILIDWLGRLSSRKFQFAAFALALILTDVFVANIDMPPAIRFGCWVIIATFIGIEGYADARREA
jgi:hypothetical protein